MDDNGGCDQKCVNSEGSYECACDGGFKLDGTAKHCMGKFMISVYLLQYNLIIVFNAYLFPDHFNAKNYSKYKLTYSYIFIFTVSHNVLNLKLLLWDIVQI